MNGTRIALVAMVTACAWAAWPAQPVVFDTHGETRKFVIHSTLARFDEPIVVLGDSIVEASTLPRSLCGRPIVNAGIGAHRPRAISARFLRVSVSVIEREVEGKRAALVVVSLGSNDAAVPFSVEQYRSNYRALLTELSALTPRSAMMAIPPPEAGLEEAKKVSVAAIDGYNAILPDLAKEARATFIPLPAMPERHTLDGLHLNAAGYGVWDKAILGGIESALCKST